MSLAARLRDLIAQTGPITVAEFMAACLHDPLDGYYATRPKLGEQGDFLTAPMISQMFGELLGLWAAEVWERLGRPDPVRLVEIGPGDGTLMQDALRALRLTPDFVNVCELWLIETSSPLRQAQAERLAEAQIEPRWIERPADLPPGAPVILIANEVLDCLPARQFVRTAKGWAERRVGLSELRTLCFGLVPPPPDLAIPRTLANAPEGAVFEASPAQIALGREVGRRIAEDGGAALFVDYGRDRSETGDTLQALKSHRKVSPLDHPGQSDLTVHADFPAFVAAAMSEGAQATPIRTQGDFLRELGIEARAALLARSRPDQSEVVSRQLERLIAPDQMGTLFKAVTIHQRGLKVPGFEGLG